MKTTSDLRHIAADSASSKGHQLGLWTEQRGGSAYANCAACGFGVVVDPGAPVEWLVVDGDALRTACVPSRALSEQRLSRHREVRPIPAEGLCGFCGAPTGDLYCGRECSHESRLRASSTYVRECLLKRDQGICGGCGADTLELAADLAMRHPDRALYAELVGRLVESGYPPRRIVQCSLWDAHHILPVSLGGGYCGLENYQTLCVPCHLRVSASGVATS